MAGHNIGLGKLLYTIYVYTIMHCTTDGAEDAALGVRAQHGHCCRLRPAPQDDNIMDGETEREITKVWVRGNGSESKWWRLEERLAATAGCCSLHVISL